MLGYCIKISQLGVCFNGLQAYFFDLSLKRLTDNEFLKEIFKPTVYVKLLFSNALE